MATEVLLSPAARRTRTTPVGIPVTVERSIDIAGLRGADDLGPARYDAVAVARLLPAHRWPAFGGVAGKGGHG